MNVEDISYRGATSASPKYKRLSILLNFGGASTLQI